MPLWIAWRYLKATKGRLFAGALTNAAILSLGLGIFATILTISIMQGFRNHLEVKLLGFSPHIRVEHSDTTIDLSPQLKEWLSRQTGDYSLMPVVEGEVIAQPAEKSGFADLGVRVRGMDIANLNLLRGAEFYFAERFFSPDEIKDGNTPFAYDVEKSANGLIMGKEVLYSLALHPESDNELYLTAPLGMLDPAGNLQPSRRKYFASGMFYTGIYQQDSKLVLMEYAEAQELLGLQARQSWFIYIPEINDAPKIAKELREYLGEGVSVQTWSDLNEKLLGALKMEQIVMGLLLLLTVAIACISILGVVLMHVNTRRRDLAILRTMGASEAFVRWVVVGVGGGIGVFGSALGVASACAVAWWLKYNPVQLPETFYVEHLPVELHMTPVFIIFIIGICLSILAAWLPAISASQFQISEELRYE